MLEKLPPLRLHANSLASVFVFVSSARRGSGKPAVAVTLPFRYGMNRDAERKVKRVKSLRSGRESGGEDAGGGRKETLSGSGTASIIWTENTSQRQIPKTWIRPQPVDSLSHMSS